MKKLVLSIALLILFSSIAHTAEWNPKPAQRAFRRLVESQNLYEFISNCTTNTRNHILDNNISFKDLSDFIPTTYSIKTIRRLSESELNSFGENLHKKSLLENAVIIEISNEKVDIPFPCFIFVYENREWSFDLLLSAALSMGKHLDEFFEKLGSLGAPPADKIVFSIYIPLDNKPDTQTMHVVLKYLVHESGLAYDVRDVYDWARQDMHRKQLTPEELKKARDIVHLLPDGTADIAKDRSVIVTEYLTNGTKQRIFDRAKLPIQMKNLFSLLGGVRLEVRDEVQFDLEPGNPAERQKPGVR